MPSSQPPRKFGRYEVLRLLGRGAVGEVWLARDPVLARDVAIKTLGGLGALPPEERAEARERFLREARAAAALAHPHIVTIHDVGEEAGVPYIAMELLRGVTLDRHTRPGHLLPPEKVVELGIQAALALDEAHRAGIVHRDVKPANMVLTGDGKLKVADFGLAKDPGTALTATDSLVGTPNYMSPEQVAGRPLDGRSDLFSLGVSLWELLAGELPFAGDTVSSVLYRVVNEPPRPLREIRPGLPERLYALLDRLLAKDPEERPSSGAEVARELHGILEEMGGVPGNLVLPPPAPPAGERGTGTGGRRETGRRGRAPRETARGWSGPRVVALLLVVAAILAALWTAPRWIGLDPLDGRRRAVEDRLEAWLGPVGRAIRVTPPDRLVPVVTDPPGLAVAVDPPARLEADGRVRVPGDLSAPVRIRVADPCREGSAVLEPGKVPPEVRIATAPRRVAVPLATDPPGAEVVLDGAPVKGRTPLELSLELCREHSLRLARRGRQPRDIVLPAAREPGPWRQALARVSLSPPPRGRLLVAAPPGYRAEVRSAGNGRRLGRAGRSIPLAPGRYRLLLVAPDVLVRREVTVRIAPGATRRVDVSWPPLGKISVRAVPPGGAVEVRRPGAGSWKDLGTTPVNGVALAAGPLEVRVHHPLRNVQVVREAAVRGGATTVVRVGREDWP